MKGESKYINQNSGDGSWSDLLGDVYSGIAVGMGHSKNFVGMNVNQGVDAIASMIGIDRPARAAHRSSAAGDVDDGRTARGLRVVGVGYGRTGTYSLALALDELGFPTLVCYVAHFVVWVFVFFARPSLDIVVLFSLPFLPRSTRNISTKTKNCSTT